MGGPRAGADTQSLATSTSSAGSAERSSLPGRRRLAVLAAYLLAGAALFTVYLRLSETYPLNSDSANILLMGRDLLHGHLLLHGWYMSDVSFYPTELPQYALLESFLGLHMQTAHVAAAMTYTLTFLLAVLLARSGSTGRAAMIRTLIAAGIMLAPQFGLGVFALDLSVGHIGTAVPLLLTWLLLDRRRPAGTCLCSPPCCSTWVAGRRPHRVRRRYRPARRGLRRAGHQGLDQGQRPLEHADRRPVVRPVPRRGGGRCGRAGVGRQQPPQRISADYVVNRLPFYLRSLA